MEGLLITPQSHRATPSHRSTINSYKKANPKRKNIDGRGPRNHRKAFPKENVCKRSDGELFKSSSSIVLMSSQKPPLLPLPSNLFPTPGSLRGFPVAKVEFRKFARNSERSPESWKGKTTATDEEGKLPITPSVPLGPDPNDLPREVLEIFRATRGEEEEASGCIFSLSPPPSSLPLPKFSLK